MGATETKKRDSKIGIIIGVVALAVVIAGAAIAYNALASSAPAQPNITQDNSSARSAQEAETQAGTEEKTDAPDFSATSPDGLEVHLSDFRGKPVVLNFWASTCGPCQREMPEFQKAYETYGEDVNFVMLNILGFNGETKEKALELISKNGYTFPVYFDSKNEASIRYGVNSIPRTFFITADGKMEAYAAGTIDNSILEQGISMIL